MPAILIFGEVQDGKIKKTTFELLSKAKELAAGEVHCALLGHGVQGLTGECAGFGADVITVVDHEKLKTYSSSAYAKALSEIVQKVKPTAVLASATPIGKDLLPKVAARMGVGMASECTHLEKAGDGRLKAKRPMYAGKVIASVEIPAASPQFFSCRPNSFAVQKTAGAGKVETLAVEFAAGDLATLIKDVVKGASAKVDLSEAEIIVAGGRSLGSADNFKILDDLAAVLGAAVGASRAAVDAGYCPHSMQVGQTGKTVNPKLYIACGISGAIQHLAGMRTSKVIVAINKDPDAPIFKIADYGIVDDLFKVVPLLTTGFKELLGQ